MRLTGVRVWLAMVILGCLLMGFSVAAAGPQAGDGAGIPIENWAGKVFIVLPLEADLKENGYPFTQVKPAADNKGVRFSLLEGKELRVQKVELATVVKEDPSIVDYVVFLEAADGAVYTAVAQGEQVEHLVLADDFRAAQQYFIGKTVYSKRPAIWGYKETPSYVLVGVDQPLKVVDVILGVRAATPVWLVVTTADGQKGYIDIAFSNTNAYRGFAAKGKPWLDRIFESNPRDIYRWTEEDWAAINRSEVKLGMLPEQVRLSWGEPNKITSGAAQAEQVWVYPAKVLKFKDNRLVSVEDC